MYVRVYTCVHMYIIVAVVDAIMLYWIIVISLISCYIGINIAIVADYNASPFMVHSAPNELQLHVGASVDSEYDAVVVIEVAAANW